MKCVRILRSFVAVFTSVWQALNAVAEFCLCYRQDVGDLNHKVCNRQMEFCQMPIFQASGVTGNSLQLHYERHGADNIYILFKYEAGERQVVSASNFYSVARRHCLKFLQKSWENTREYLGTFWGP